MIFAMPTAAPAIPPNPSTPAIKAITKGNHQMQHGLSSQSAACTSKRQ
jgi:hypothetical protein